MKTLSAIKRGAARIATLVTILAMSVTNTHARIIFDDDLSFPVNSSGITLDANNNGSTDIQIQFGNTGTDASINYNITDDELEFANPNGALTFQNAGYNVLKVEDISSLGADKGAVSLNYYFNNKGYSVISTPSAPTECTTGERIIHDYNGSRVLYNCDSGDGPGGAADTLSVVNTNLYMYQNVFASFDEFGFSTPYWSIGQSAPGKAEFDTVSSNKFDFDIIASTELTQYRLDLEDNNATAFTIGNAGTGPDMITFNTSDSLESIAINVDTSITGDFDASNATQTRIREEDMTGNVACTDVNEIAYDTITGYLWRCTAVGIPAGTWQTLATEHSASVGGVAADQLLRSQTDDTFGDGSSTGSVQTLTIGDGVVGDTLNIANNAIFKINGVDIQGTTDGSEGATKIGTGGFINISGSTVQEALDSTDATIGIIAGAFTGLNDTVNGEQSVYFTAEYPNAVLNTASAGRGILSTADDSTHLSYNWQTTQTSNQATTIHFEYMVPANFDNTLNSLVKVFFKTATTTAADNNVGIGVAEVGGASCGSLTNQTSSVANTWAFNTIDTSSCSLVAGDIVRVTLTLNANDTVPSASTDVADVIFTYNTP